MVELVAAPRGEHIDTLAEVNGIVGKHDLELWRQLDHGLGAKEGGAERLALRRVSSRQMQCQTRAISALEEQARVRVGGGCRVARDEVSGGKL